MIRFGEESLKEGISGGIGLQGGPPTAVSQKEQHISRCNVEHVPDLLWDDDLTFGAHLDCGGESVGGGLKLIQRNHILMSCRYEW